MEAPYRMMIIASTQTGCDIYKLYIQTLLCYLIPETVEDSRRSSLTRIREKPEVTSFSQWALNGGVGVGWGGGHLFLVGEGLTFFKTHFKVERV